MFASGRKLAFRLGLFRLVECPLLVKLDTQPGRMSANRPKADIGLLWV